MFQRRYSRLPVLCVEKFALSESLSKRARQLRTADIRATIIEYMQRLSTLLVGGDFRLSCLNVLQFFAVNNRGQHDSNPVPISNTFIEQTEVSHTHTLPTLLTQYIDHRR